MGCLRFEVARYESELIFSSGNIIINSTPLRPTLDEWGRENPWGHSVQNHWAVSVSGNWRMTFCFEGRDAILIDYQDYHQESTRRMRNPPHPGKAVREFLGEMTVTEAASRLGVTRVSLSRILNGTNGISADMALRLAAAFGTSAELWISMRCPESCAAGVK